MADMRDHARGQRARIAQNAAAIVRIDSILDPAAFAQGCDGAADIHRRQAGDFDQIVSGQCAFTCQRHDHAQFVAADLGRIAHAVAHRS